MSHASRPVSLFAFRFVDEANDTAAHWPCFQEIKGDCRPVFKQALARAQSYWIDQQANAIHQPLLNEELGELGTAVPSSAAIGTVTKSGSPT